MYYKDSDGSMKHVRNVRHNGTAFLRDRAIFYGAISAGGYPNWGDYAPSPLSADDYPYQLVFQDQSGTIYLIASADEIKEYEGFVTVNTQNMLMYIYLSNNWAYSTTTTGIAVDNPIRIASIYDVYSLSGLLWLAKNTDSISQQWNRVNL